MRMFRLNRNLKVLFVLNLAFSTCVGLVSPLFPLFLDGTGANILEISLVLFVGGVATTILMVPSGLLSDRYRRRNILILSSIMYGLAAFYLTTVRNWEQSILGFVIFSSASTLSLPAIFTLIADNADSTRLAKTFGLIQTGWPVGLMIGSALGGFLADNYGWNYTFYVVVLISLLSIIPNYFFKRTYKGDKMLDKKQTRGTFFTRGIITFLFLFSLSQLLLSSANGILNPVIPLYLTENFNVNETAVGFFFSMGLGLATLVTQVPSGMLADRYGYKKILVYSILPVPIILLFWPVIGDYFLLMILYMFIIGLGSMTWSVAPVYLMNLTPTLDRGLVVSISETAVKLGFTLGPLIGGYFSYIYSSVAPFYVSSVFFALSFFLILFLRKPNRK